MQDYYTEQKILLTGATGFLGKIILHQLLKTKVRKVFLIVRPREGQTPHSRIEALFAEDPFQRTVDSRIVVLEGDISKPRLGLSHVDEAYLRSEVSVYINNAASVRFEHSLRSVVELNLISTLEALLLAKSWPRLNCFVYVSTAYSNCPLAVVQEKVYRHIFVSLENLLRAYETDPASLSKWNLRGHPNTYTFSKQHAEALVASSGLPHVIVRPPTIVGSLAAPSRGWVDNFNGFNSLILLSEIGRNLPLHAAMNSPMAVAPVDVCANVVLGAAWRRNVRPENLVYNCSDSRTAPSMATIGRAINSALEHQVPSRKLRLTSSRIRSELIFIFLFLIPALLKQFFNILTRNPDRPLRKVLRGKVRCAMVEYFTSTTIFFEYKNVRELSEEIPPHERHIFNTDLSAIDWPTFLQDSALCLWRFAEDRKARRRNTEMSISDGNNRAATTNGVQDPATTKL
ncbi:fatty acyl-CoA reductase 1-like [Galendromus occidentalis]|uniref:Fatty acyl-CoA reductase n=1 Tax=Galendromus occidentalis TaxID=34638 RepID=A0AAJ6QUG9_9ACAR|nr:fatty acyl-CoA reductase 1-like [Galendromus occidentalis]